MQGEAPQPAERPRIREAGLVSVVCPLYDERDGVEALYDRVSAALTGLAWELVAVDDGSTDGTSEALRELADADERVKLVALSRNFGHQAALTAGLEHARGDAVVTLDGDLQDPPELIPTMLQRWEQGSDVVYAVRRARAGETRFKLLTARWFYRVFGALSPVDLPPDAGDFRLMDRAPLDDLLRMRERNRFLRGMTVWVGYTQTAVEYERAARAAGETKFTLRRMVRFSLDALVSFSSVPLQLATVLGFLCSALAFALVPLAIVGRIFDQFARGIPTTLVIVLLLGGIQLIAIGVIGEYVGRIYDEVKRRPLYLVRDRRNVDPPPEP